MFGFEKIGLTLSFNSILFFIILAALGAYAVFSYLHTVPEVSSIKKLILVSLRTLALLLLLFVVFEPVLSLTRKETFPPVNLVFVDNSRSLTIEDGTKREENVRDFVAELQRTNISSFSQLYTFGNRTYKVKRDSVLLPFNEGNTNFASVFDEVELSKENISSVTIISDGVITDGSNPLYKAVKLNIPVFTVGIGDSSGKNDVEVRDITANEYIYADVPTVISAGISNSGYSGENVTLSLSEGGRIISQESINLSGNGFQEVKFDYKSATPGEKKITVAVTNVKGEQNIENNRKVVFINVLSNKIKVLLIAGSPSPDLSFIRNSLRQDNNLTVNSITQISPGKFLENTNRDQLIDSADIFFLIGFPSKESDKQFLDKIIRKIVNERKPFTLLLSEGTDLSRLQNFQNDLPFSINRITEGFSEVLADINQSKIRNPLLQSGRENNAADWNALPPVMMVNSDISPKPESEVLATVKIRNTAVNKPLIITRKLGSRKSVAILAKDIWRWKLQSAVKEIHVYDNFLHNSIKWLNTSEDQKQVVVRTSKKLYSLGEEIYFTGQVYDASFEPIPDARLTVSIISGDQKNEFLLDPLGNGIYEGMFTTNRSGDYSFTGEAFVDGNRIGSDKGSFNIGEVDIEMMNPGMDYQFLSLLSAETNGRFFLPSERDELFRVLKQRAERASDDKIITSEFSLWSNEWLMILVIFLFAAEWFIRKQSGML
jgi:hypothetical protein